MIFLVLQSVRDQKSNQDCFIAKQGVFPSHTHPYKHIKWGRGMAAKRKKKKRVDNNQLIVLFVTIPSRKAQT